MAPNSFTNNSILHSPQTRMFIFLCLAVFITLILPSTALADPADASTTVCGFASSINKILNGISIVVVTIAIVFSGYQIAFAHKRIGDVAPVLIGAILIGAASQIANMFLSKSAGSEACSPTGGIVKHALDHYAVVVHLLHHYA